MTQTAEAENGTVKSQWLRDAKWGFFTHYMAHMASEHTKYLTPREWSKKVDSFDVKRFADQLSALNAPYCFLTIGQSGNYFCSPNETFDRHYGADLGSRPRRDLIADIAAELVPRGIKMCVYLWPDGVGPGDAPNRAQVCREVITEWSQRWGESVSAWWSDGAKTLEFPEYQAYMNAFKAGNRDALVATKFWHKLPEDQVLEDYLGGESGFLLEVSDTHYHHFRKGVTDKLPLHFLTFLGEFWGYGRPRFPVKVVTGWTQHVNNLGGTVSWDCPLTDSGEIPEDVYQQLEIMSRNVNADAS
jgi:hypothetical protein